MTNLSFYFQKFKTGIHGIKKSKSVTLRDSTFSFEIKYICSLCLWFRLKVISSPGLKLRDDITNINQAHDR